MLPLIQLSVANIYLYRLFEFMMQCLKKLKLVNFKLCQSRMALIFLWHLFILWLREWRLRSDKTTSVLTFQFRTKTFFLWYMNNRPCAQTSTKPAILLIIFTCLMSGNEQIICLRPYRKKVAPLDCCFCFSTWIGYSPLFANNPVPYCHFFLSWHNSSFNYLLSNLTSLIIIYIRNNWSLAPIFLLFS